MNAVATTNFLYAKINRGIISTAFLLSTEDQRFEDRLGNLPNHDLEIDDKKYREVFLIDPPKKEKRQNPIDLKLVKLSNQIGELFSSTEEFRRLFRSEGQSLRENFASEFLVDPRKYRFPLEVINDKSLNMFSKFLLLRYLMSYFSKDHPSFDLKYDPPYQPLFSEVDNLENAFAALGNCYKTLYELGFEMHSLWVEEVE